MNFSVGAFPRLSRTVFRSPVGGRVHLAGLVAAATLTVLSAATAHEFKNGALKIEHPWSRAAPPGAKVAGGYVVIHNEGAEDDRLIGVEAAIAGRTEIHEMKVNAEGVMTMRPVEGGVAVPAGGEAELKPGGFHIMFMDLKQRPARGEKFPGKLVFEKAGAIPVEFAVEAAGGSSSGHGAHGG